MKKRLLITSSLALMLGLGVAGGLSLAKNSSKSVSAADENWYYRGNGKGMNWGDGSDDYVLHNVDFDSSGVNWSFAANEEFVFTNDKTNWNKYGVSSFSGTAAWAFQKTGGNYDNLRCNLAGNYNLSLFEGKLYVDFADGTNLYYVGSNTSKAPTAWTNYTAKPIALNGSAVSMPFIVDEQFKIRMFDNWDHNVYGYSDIKDNDYFYNSFISGSDGNVKVTVAADYNVSAVTNGHSINIVLHGSVDNKVYVYDIYGNLLNETHNAYVWNDHGNNGWPGASMGATTGTSNIYEFTYWEKLTSIIFNQGEGAGETIDLTPENGKCLLLTGETVDYKWSSSTWYELEVTKFIDKYMKFETYRPEDAGEGKCVSQGWYTAAKSAYQASSFAPYREELCSIGIVVDRLQAWAAANGDTFVVTNNVGSFSAYKNVLIDITPAADNTIIPIVIAAVLAVAGVGGYFFFRRKRHE